MVDVLLGQLLWRNEDIVLSVLAILQCTVRVLCFGSLTNTSANAYTQCMSKSNSTASNHTYTNTNCAHLEAK
jgi:hypothetical protein